MTLINFHQRTYPKFISLLDSGPHVSWMSWINCCHGLHFLFLYHFFIFSLLMKIVHRIHFATRNPPTPSILLRHYLNVKFYPFPKTSKEQNVRMLVSWRICDLMETKSRLICISVPPSPSLSSFFLFRMARFSMPALHSTPSPASSTICRERMCISSFVLFLFWLLATVAFCLFPVFFAKAFEELIMNEVMNKDRGSRKDEEEAAGKKYNSK